MIFENVELHNVTETHPTAGGVRLHRAPEWVRNDINERSQEQMQKAKNSEIRFVCESGPAEITLSSEGETSVMVFLGCFDAKIKVMLGKEPTMISLDLNDRFKHLDRSSLPDAPFSSHVWRVVFGGSKNDPVIFHGVKGKGIRPPTAEELPSLRYLAYGTSITQGASATGPHLCYVAQAAWHLGADLINLGSGGSCHCENVFADFIAGREDWDIATLSLSVNMQRFTLEEFHSRVDYMVNTVAGSNPDRPVACITLFPYFRDLGVEPQDFTPGGKPEDYRQILRNVVQECPHPNVHLLEGPELLTDVTGLTTDLIHPSDLGMIQMGWNLSQKLKELLERR